MKHSVFAVSAVLGVLMLGSSVVSAAPITLDVCSGSECWAMTSQIADDEVVNWTNVETMKNGGGNSVNDWETSRGLGNVVDVSDWSLSMDSDPFVTNNFNITNFTSSTQTFSVTTTLGVTTAITNGLMKGSVAVTVTDNDSNSATVSTDPTPLEPKSDDETTIYQGLIDGNVARTLWDDPKTITAPVGSNSESINFGFTALEIAPESIDSTIGTTITFALSAGDSASVTSNFTVVPVPPAVWLFGSGLLGLVGIARRRRS